MQELNKVKGYRVMAGYTQDEMACQLGISKRSYVDKENGNAKFTLDELKKFKEIMGLSGLVISLDYLVQ